MGSPTKPQSILDKYLPQQPSILDKYLPDTGESDEEKIARLDEERKRKIDRLFGPISNTVKLSEPGQRFTLDYEGLSPEATSFVAAATKATAKNWADAAGSAYDTITNPDLWDHYIKKGAEDIAGLVSQGIDKIGNASLKDVLTSPVTIPYHIIKGLVESLAIDPFVKEAKAANYYYSTPTGEFDEQKFNSDASAIGDLAAGLVIGGVANKAVRGITNLATMSKLARRVTRAGSMEEAMQIMERSSIPALFRGADDVVKNQGFLTKAIRGTISGGLAGAGFGYLEGQSSEERFQNAMNSGIVGAVLGTGIEATLHVISGKKNTGFSDLMRAKAIDKTVKIIREKYPLEDQATIALDFAKGKNLAESVIRQSPDRVVYLDGFPDAIGLEGKKGIYVYKNPDGSVRILADRVNDLHGDTGEAISLTEPSISPQAGKLFEKFGAAPGQRYSYKGAEYIIEGVSEKYIKLFDETSKKSKTISRKDLLSPVDGPYSVIGKVEKEKFVSEMTSGKKVEFNPKDFVSGLSPDELTQWEQFKIDRTKFLDNQDVSLSASLLHKGLYLEDSGGKLILRKINNNEVIGEYKTRTELIKDVEGNAVNDLISGKDIEGISDPPNGSNIPPIGNVDPLGPSSAENAKRGITGQVYDKLRVKFGTWLSPRREVISALDNIAKQKGIDARLFPDWMDTQIQSLSMHGKLSPAIQRISEIVKDFSKDGLKEGDLQHLFNAVQTLSAEEMKTRGIFKNKPLNDLVKQFGETLFRNSNADERVKIYTYMNKLDKLKQKIASQHMDAAYAEKLISGLQSEYPRSVVTLGHSIYENITKLTQKEATILEVFSYADALDFQPLSRGEYLKRFGLDPKKFGPAIERIDKFFEDYAKEFGIPEHTQLNNYISHIKRYGAEVGNPGVLGRDNAFASLPQDFFAELSRTGFFKNLETDPFQVMYKYVSRGYWDRYLKEPINHLEKSLNDMAESIAAQGNRSGAEGVKKYVNAYVRKLRGGADPFDAIARSAGVNFLERMGVSKYHAQSLSSIWLKTAEFSAQGFKPIAGVRDMVVSIQNYNMRFGYTRTGRMIKTIIDGVEEAEKKMNAQGVGLPESSTIYTSSGLEKMLREAVDNASTGIDKLTGLKAIPGRVLEAYFDAIDKFSGVGFNMSLQPWAYRAAWAGSYMETYKTVMDSYAKLSRGEITRAKFERLIDLDTYEPTVIEDFNRLLEGTRSETAAKKLAFVTGMETVGFYGQANHPMFMDTKIGRIAGQFGSWPIWQTHNFLRLLSNGRKTNRALMLGRASASIGALWGASQLTGISFERFSLDPRNSIFLGGPLAQAAWFGLNAVPGIGNPALDGFSQWYMDQFIDPTRKNLWNPIPMQLYDALEALNRMNEGDPMYIVIARALGIPVSYEEYPRSY